MPLTKASASFALASVLLLGDPVGLAAQGAGPTGALGIVVQPAGAYLPPSGEAEALAAARKARDPKNALWETYRDLRVVDAHNHGASGNIDATLAAQRKYFVDATALFGDISEPSAVGTDTKAFAYASRHPGRVFPYFAGIPLRDKAGLATARANLEAGYLGIGEIVAASLYSPVTSKLPWKALNPNEGILPGLYRLAAEYRVPVLLHIDPPNGEPVLRLEEALDANPDTVIVFGHANAYNSPESIERLVSRHPNLMIDFFAGFTAYNPESGNKLADFAPVIERHSDRFVASTDSGYGVGLEKALAAIYELLDLLSPEAACKVAHGNYDRVVESEAPTAAQVARIAELSRKAGLSGVRRLNRREANELIFELEGKAGK
jgi:predicted TIM-barrel fold metal-dependent hydrolase